MQTGVAHEQAGGSTCGTPKHLRVGVNSALVDGAALAKLLIAKGVFTEAEYAEAVTVEMEAEAERYAARLSEKFGVNIKLG